MIDFLVGFLTGILASSLGQEIRKRLKARVLEKFNDLRGDMGASLCWLRKVVHA